MTYKVPTLSRAGWSTSVSERIDFLLSDFFTAQVSQTYLFAGSVSSLSYLIQYYQGDVPALVTALRDTLQRYLGSYFDSVVVDVSSDMFSEDTTGSTVTLKLFCQVMDNDRLYSVGHELQTSGSKLMKIVKYNNEGIIE